MKYISLFLFLFSKLSAITVIVGGGPGGLAAAIACKLQGEEVLIIEKRIEYTRDRFLFLTPNSLDRLKIWNVDIPEIRITEISPGTRIGFLSIRELEKGLFSRAIALGVRIRHASFLGFHPERKAIFLENDPVPLAYDLLIGADGTHSRVRQALGIPFEQSGSGVAVAAIFSTKQNRNVDISPPVQKGRFFARRIASPGFSLVLIQSTGVFTPEEIDNVMSLSGWEEETVLLRNNQVDLGSPIPVRLGRAKRFSDPSKGTVLIGDAAAEASFFAGRGANTAIETGAIAGQYLTLLQKGEFEGFEQAMETATDILLEKSRYLFENMDSIRG